MPVYAAKDRVWTKLKELAPILALLVGVGFVFSGLLSGDFLWDDEYFVVKNIYCQSFSTILKLFTENMVSGVGATSNFYRPVQSMTHLIDNRVWGPNPFGHRLSNLLLYCITSVLLFLVARSLLNPKNPVAARWPAFFAVSLYVFHPIQVAAVGYVSGRGDILVILMACVAAISFADRFWLCCIALVFGLLSKENGVVLPLFVLGYDWVVYGPKLRWRKHLALFGTSAFYVFLRLTVLNFKDTLNFSGQKNILTENYLYRIYTYLSTLPKALQLVFWPNDIHHQRSWEVATSIGDPRVWAGLLIVFAVVLFSIISFRRDRLISFCVLWWLMATLPTSNLIALINALFFDHWFIFPSFGIFLIVGLLFQKIWTHFRVWGPPISIFVWLLVLGPLLFWTSEQVQAWSHPIALYEYILRYEPKAGSILSNLGAEYDRHGQPEKAVPYYLRSIAVSDRVSEVHHNLGVYYLNRGEVKEAISEFQKALAMDPRLYRSLVGLGMSYSRLGDFLHARASYLKALEIYPDTDAQTQLGLLPVSR